MPNLRTVGNKSLLLTQNIGLLLIAIGTVIAAGIDISAMIDARAISLADLLLLFIYLEVLAMVEIYLGSGKLPVRMPLYIAIVALARYLILDMKNLETWRMLGIAAAILVITVSVLAIRYGHHRFPYDKPEDS
jgi:protein PsiE